MKRMLFKSLLIILIMVGATDLCAQDVQTYYLSDGRIITGELLRIDQGTVYVTTSLGEKSFREDQIWKIEKDGKTVFENKKNNPQSKKSSFASKYGTPTTQLKREKRNMRIPVIGAGALAGSIRDVTGEFGTGTVVRGNVALFVPGGLSLEPLGNVTVGFEVGISRFSVETELGSFEEERKKGTADVNSVLLLLVAQIFPSKAPGIGFHANLGISLTRTSIDEFDPWIAEDTVFLLGGGGVNIFLIRYLSLTVDISGMFGDIDITDPTETVFHPWVDTFLASNFQISGGIKLWF